jgi:exonuclease 3'-5' domain-containing protein 1
MSAAKVSVDITPNGASILSSPEAKIAGIFGALEKSNASRVSAYNLVATDADVANLVESLEKLPADPLALFVDLEGVNLSRHGSVSLLQIFTLPQEQTRLVDIHTLKERAFTQASANDTTLKSILGSPSVTRFFLTCVMTPTPFLATLAPNLLASKTSS